MRKVLTRGAMIVFVSAIGFLGTGGEMHFDGLHPSLEGQTASAAVSRDAWRPCTSENKMREP